MKKILLALLLIIAGLLGTFYGCEPRPLPPLEIYFSPKGGIQEAVVAEISRARKTILVQAYSFTSGPLAAALREAHKRGVAVQIILDKQRVADEYREPDFFLHAGVAVLLDGKHPIAHNKVIIIDDQVVITGSYNFTKQAESNAENVLVIRDGPTAKLYTRNWQFHAQHSEPYLGKSPETEDEPKPAPKAKTKRQR